MLTDAEQERLILRALQVAPDGVSEDDLVVLLTWANKVLLEATLVDLVLAGEMEVHMRAGEPKFQLSPTGTAKAKALVAQLAQLN